MSSFIRELKGRPSILRARALALPRLLPSLAIPDGWSSAARRSVRRAGARKTH